MSDTFDAYHKWLGVSAKDQPPNHYRLLGVDRFESDPDVIASAADQRMAHVRSFQIGKHSDLSQKLLNEIAAAKVRLLNAGKKVEYDRQLRQNMEIAAPPIPVAPPSKSSETPLVSTDTAPPAFHPLEASAPEKHSRFVPVAIVAAVVFIAATLAFLSFDRVSPDRKQEDVGHRSGAPVPVDPPPAQPTTPKLPDNSKTEPTEPPPDKSDDTQQDPVPEPAGTTVTENSHGPVQTKETAPADPPVPDEETIEEVVQQLHQAFGRSKTRADFQRVVANGLILVDRAIVEGDLEAAREVSTLALAAARKTGDAPLVKKVTLRILELQKPLAEIQEAARQRLKAVGAASKDPSSPDTNTPRSLGDLLERESYR